MIKLSNASIEFLRKYVFNELGITELNEENQEDIVMFISKKIEDPMSSAQADGEEVDEELLMLASDVITEITSDW